MHSLDHFFSKLSPEQGQILARAFQNPMARAYRAKEKTMPDMEENKDKPDKEAPKMAEGAPRDVAVIEAEILKTRLAGGDVAALLDEWLAAKMAATAGNGPASAPEPVVPPTMGMKPEDAYARAKRESDKAAAVAFVKVAPGLDEKQRAWLSKQCSTVADVEEALEAMPRAQATVGLPQHPAKRPGNAEPETPYARMRKGPADPVVREALGLSNAPPGQQGIGECVGHILTLSFFDRAQEYQTKYRAKMAKAREAA